MKIDLEISPWNTYTIRLPIAVVGTGKTVKAKLCEDYVGDPTAIASALDVVMTEAPTSDPTAYVGTFTTANLLTSFLLRISDVIACHVYTPDGYHSQAWVLISGSRARLA